MFVSTLLTSAITEFALALTPIKERIWKPSGTAIIVGAHLTITAKHIVMDYRREYETSLLEYGSHKGSFHIVASQFLNEVKSGSVWSIIKFWCAPNTDIGFLLIFWYRACAPLQVTLTFKRAFQVFKLETLA